MRPKADKDNAKLIFDALSNVQTNKRFATYLFTEHVRFICRRLKGVNKDQLNTHVDVSPCNNGCVYHLQQPPIFAPGLPGDLMVLQYDLDYVPDEQLKAVPEINMLLFDLSSRSQDELSYILAFLGSSVISRSPGKVCLLFADYGDSGKSQLQNLFRNALKPKYALLCGESLLF